MSLVSTLVPNSVSFLAIEGSDTNGWDVVKKTFPTVLTCPIMKTVSGVSTTFQKVIVGHFDDRQEAHDSIKRLSESSHLKIISTDAVTLVSSLGCVKITSLEEVISLGGHCSLEEAREKASKMGLPFIEPN